MSLGGLGSIKSLEEERDKKSIRVGREEEKVVNSHGLSLTTGAVSCCV